MDPRSSHLGPARGQQRVTRSRAVRPTA